jgi:hypothetical protein
MEIVETGYEHVRSIQNTYAVNKKSTKDGIDVVFNEDLGLACESLPQGVKIDDVWKIV